MIVKTFLQFSLLAFALLFFGTTASASEPNIIVDGDRLSFQESIFVENNRTYVPVRFISENMNADVKWDQLNQKVTIETTIGDTIILYIGRSEVTLNDAVHAMDVSPIVRHNRTYLPIRHISEILHSEVAWRDGNVHINRVPLHVIKSGETLTSIAQNTGVTVEQLRERNGLSGWSLFAGEALKIVIPSLMNENFVDEDVDLLARLIHLEANGQPMSGKVAVGSVVMNRVASSSFPNSIREVIYQPRQFTPVGNGRINSVTASERSIEAARRAIAGENQVANALFFFNPRISSSSYLHGLTPVTTIGDHRFSR
ncbi:cell wall hydrolase [Paenalkalicoccus suaedae]|uniref:Cell wall hydrolase n=1 Tax=Paenalkalicoccus suaedae TaxID=2592382 RepID=A0A859FJC9_9BACI|nr:cell wall hydrolase [Paenalkalicoccus suaedae]QKS72775.1 cell wall hydrolase [Paenalkalicoccus suaedae]